VTGGETVGGTLGGFTGVVTGTDAVPVPSPSLASSSGGGLLRPGATRV
jgi:hypothetical protein